MKNSLSSDLEVVFGSGKVEGGAFVFEV